IVVIDTRPKDEEGQRYNHEEMGELEKKVTQPLVLINPKIIKGYGKTTFDEGCLSVPSFYETVERYEEIEVETYDLQGKKKTFKTDRLLAICIQHELDHLEGKLFIDHLSFLKSNKIKNQIKKHGYPEPKTEKEKVERKS
ncbi:MAG: peptide deformylase, partial [Bdellovibrionales bacterium]|nr:peptide deformylase [Bdellovibrionales bacterium]